MKQSIATVISRIFDPFVMIFVWFCIVFYSSPLFVPAFLMMVLLPLTLFIIAWKTKVVANWDITDRRERPKIFWAFLGIEIVVSLLLKTSYIVPFLVVMFGFAVITQFWKISGHAMAAAWTTGYIVAHFGWGWWPVLFAVPLVGWARVVRKNHTLLQVIAGALYSWSLLIFFEKIFNI